MKIKTKLMFVLNIFLLALILGHSTINYQLKKDIILNDINKELFDVATLSQTIIGEDYHDNIIDKNSVSEKAYLQLVDQYNNLCRELNLEYIWSLLQIDNTIVFTSSTSTSKDIKNGDHALFFDIHTNPEAYKKVFDTMEPEYQTINDKWGTLYATLLPYYDKHGRKYLFCASMKTDNLEILFKKQILESVVIGFIILLIGSFVGNIFSRSIAKPLIYLSRSARLITKGRFTEIEIKSDIKEIQSLSESISNMSGAIKYKIEELTESEENLKITLNSIGDGVIATDVIGQIVEINPVAEVLTGWSFDKAYGEDLPNVFHIINEETGDICENPVEKVLRLGEIVGLENHTVLISKEGIRYQIADSGAPILNKNNEIVGVVLVFRDMTENYRHEENLRQIEKMESLGQLAGGIAHDFNNMLAGIIGSTDLLFSKIDNESPLIKHLKVIENASERAADLTGKLLNFSRKGQILSEAFDIHKAIQATVSLIERSIDKRIHLELNLNAKETMILGDPSQFQNSILNMAINARDAMPEGGEIKISTTNQILTEEDCPRFSIKAGSFIEIKIRDTGTGIDKKTLSKIFDPFFTTKPVGKGTGLGLPAVYGMVTDHHGAIHAYSEQDHGTEFKIYLPLSGENNTVQTFEKQKKLEKGTGQILIIDDEALMRETLKTILEELGYSTLLAEDGIEGIEIYNREKENIDLIILDMVMPRLNGYDTAKILLKTNPHIKILISSGFSPENNIGELTKNQFIETLQKPFKIIELSSKIKTILQE